MGAEDPALLDPELERGFGDNCLTHLSCSCYSKRSLVTARGEKINWLIFAPRNEGNLRWDLGNPLKYCCHYFFCTCEKGKKHISVLVFQNFVKSQATTLQSTMNAKLSKQRFWHCYENGLIKTIQTIPHNIYVSVKLTSLYCGLRIILVYPNPQ